MITVEVARQRILGLDSERVRELVPFPVTEFRV
jgi:hypothetical protein